MEAFERVHRIGIVIAKDRQLKGSVCPLHIHQLKTESDLF